MALRGAQAALPALGRTLCYNTVLYEDCGTNGDIAATLLTLLVSRVEQTASRMKNRTQPERASVSTVFRAALTKNSIMSCRRFAPDEQRLLPTKHQQEHLVFSWNPEL